MKMPTDQAQAQGGNAMPPPVGAAFLLSQVGAHAALEFAKKLTEVHLKPHHAGILRLLGSNPGLSQQTLSDLLGIFPSQLVRFIDALEEKKFVERRDSPQDRRSYRLHLTSKGKTTLGKIGILTESLENELFASLSGREKHLMQELLERVAAHQRITPGVHPAYEQMVKEATREER